MLKVYCQDCGSPTNYSNTKPKFCSSCGKSFHKNILANTVKLQKPIIKDENDDFYDEDEIVANIPNINKLDFDIGYTQPTKIKIKDIISDIPEELLSGTEDQKKPKKIKNIKNRKIKNQEFLKEIKSEAGTLRPSRNKSRESSDG